VIGRALARHFVNAGCGVVLSNSRGPESLAAAVAELGGEDAGVFAGTTEEALAADIVVLSQCDGANEAVRRPSALIER
jgi:predicted dinucleotide-binding enzyme